MTPTPRFSSAVLLGAVLTVACSSEPSRSDGSSPPADGGALESDANGPAPDFPSDLSVEGLQAFLAAEQHDGPGWTRESPSPRAPISEVSPHGRVRVHVNDTLVASIEAGNGSGIDAPPHAAGSMAVKELYSDEDELLGRAAILRPDNETTLYYCHGPSGRCINGRGEFTTDDPLYSDDGSSGCAFCHGGLIFSVEAGQL